MAREYARIMTAIWRNRDFRALDQAAQRMYLLLVTQPDISAVGLLPLRIRRWADMAEDTKADDVVDALNILDAGRFIATDYDTEEVLVRAFVRWDGGFTNSKRRPVIIRDADELESSRLRRMLASEFERCGLPALEVGGPPDDPAAAPLDDTAEKAADRASGRQRNGARAHRRSTPDVPSDAASHSASDRTYTESPRMMNTESSQQVDAASDRTPPFTGVAVTQVGSTDTTTHNPQPVPPPAGDAAPATAQTLTGEWLDTCRKRPPKAVIGQMAKAIKEMLSEGIDPDDIRAGIQHWATRGLHPSTLPSVVNEVMNARPAALQLVVGGATPPATRPSGGTTSERVNAILALKRGNT